MTHKYTLGNFYPHKGNEVAFLAARKIIEFPGQVFNPLYLYGAEGLGKTHLLSALNDELSKKFVTHFLTARGFEKSLAESRTFDSPLIIDDADLIGDEYKTRLHEVVERAVGENVQVCMSASAPPMKVEHFSPRFCSLIESGLLCELFPPDVPDGIEIIKKKAEESGIIIPEELATGLAQMGTNSMSTISNMINRLVTYSSLGDLPSDVASVKSILKELSPRKRSCPTPAVLEMVANADLWELHSTKVPDLKLEYEKNISVWQLMGFDVSILKEKSSKDATQLRGFYADFVTRARRLLELQDLFHDRAREMERTKSMRIETMMFNPGNVQKIEDLLGAGRHPARTFRRFVSFIIGASNREVWHKYHDDVLENLGSCNPCFVMGGKGTGKTHFLEAICDDLLSRGKSVAFYDLKDTATVLELDEIAQCDVLTLDNMAAAVDDLDRMNHIIEVVDKFMAADKQVLIGMLPLQDTSLRKVSDLMAKGLILELGAPSADIVIEYIRRAKPREADALIEKGIPGFQSFLELEYYLKSLVEGESMVVPLGLPGEDEVSSGERQADQPESTLQRTEGKVRLKGSPVDIREGDNYLIPDLSAELVEESY